MADKIENKQVAEKQQDNALSNLAFDLMKGAAMGAVGGAIAGEKTARDMALSGIAGGIAGGAVGAAAAEIVKENKSEINKGVKVIGDEIKRQAQEIKDTPKDVMDHVQKRPVTSIVEGVILGPGAVILDAKLRKWFGDK